MPPYAAPGSPEKKLESLNAQKVARLLANKLKLLGFERTKTSIFTRSKPLVIEFVHIHKFSFEASFRVHFGVRVRTDNFPGTHLNGPSSDEMRDTEDQSRRRYTFSFGQEEASWDACAEEILQCVLHEGSAWFASMESQERLLSPSSPLTYEARLALQRELQSAEQPQVSEHTRKALNAA
jgi:hypothetical protein